MINDRGEWLLSPHEKDLPPITHRRFALLTGVLLAYLLLVAYCGAFVASSL